MGSEIVPFKFNVPCTVIVTPASQATMLPAPMLTVEPAGNVKLAGMRSREFAGYVGEPARLVTSVHVVPETKVIGALLETPLQ